MSESYAQRWARLKRLSDAYPSHRASFDAADQGSPYPTGRLVLVPDDCLIISADSFRVEVHLATAANRAYSRGLAVRRAERFAQQAHNLVSTDRLTDAGLSISEAKRCRHWCAEIIIQAMSMTKSYDDIPF